MPPTTSHDRPMLAPAVETLLGTLRRRIRQYIWLEGCAAAVAWLGMAFWLTLAADWFFEPPPAVRAVMLAAVVAVLAAVLVRLIGRRIFVRITNANAAMVLERRFPHLNDSLLTAVGLGDRLAAAGTAAWSPRGADVPSAAKREDADVPSLVEHDAVSVTDLNREMLAHTCREAAERIGEVDLLQVFNPLPLCLHGGAAALLSLSVVFFAVLFSTEFGVWARRTLAMSDVPWPRSTRLEVVGFENNVRKVARGADFEVVVRADAAMPRVPETVEIRYRTEGGGRGRATMDRRGAVRGPQDRYQEYTYTFRGVLADVRFDVLGGDDRKRGYRIEAVDSPTISQMTVKCELPGYIGRKLPPQPVTGVMQIPMGSRMTVLAAQANKEIVSVRVNSVVGDRVGPARSLDERELAADRRGFSCKLEPLITDTTLLFTLTDSDGIESRDPVRLTLVATPDQAPQLAVQLDGIGTAITPAARVAVSGQISDDYGIGRVWFERAIDQQPPHTHPLAEFRQPPAVYNLADAGLDVRELGLRPGQRLSVCLKAADLCDLGHGPNVASTESWLLDVVTPDQLRAILAARELVLRQRFEQMIQEMSDTRDLLARMEFAAAEKEGSGVRDQGPGDRGQGSGVRGQGSESPNLKPSNPKSPNLQTSKPPNSPGPHPNPLPKGEGTRPGAEPGDEEPADSPTRRRELRFLRLQSALTNCHKGAPEVLGVAESIDDIYKQFVNNRIDTVELKNRLRGNIAEPLHRIVDAMFPELNRRIEELQTALDDLDRAPSLRDAAQQQAQAVLLAMQKVRDHMIELEDFNEAVELLRNIVDMQKKLHEETQKRHNEKIRDLLKE
ncbi:MAG: hypothetical protein WBL72_25115 [Thermoguttaceae bacterium]